MKIILPVVLIFASLAAFAKGSKNYFLDHVSESISINQQRKLVYRELSLGESDQIFRSLIGLEYVMLPSAKIYDLRANYFQRRGIDLFANEFMSMDRTPDFDPKAPRVIPQETPIDYDWKEIKMELKKLIKDRDLEGIKKKTLEVIELLSANPKYYCMSRHMIESIYRFAYFMPSRIEEARILGLRSPEKLMYEVMDFHLLGTHHFYKIDRLSLPLHQKGIPVLCTEIPDLMQDL